MLQTESIAAFGFILTVVFAFICLVLVIAVFHLMGVVRKYRDEAHNLFLENQLLKKESGFTAKQLDELKQMINERREK